MFAPVWDRVVQGRYRRMDATLDGFRRLTVIGDTYPALVAEPQASVGGVLYADVSADDVERLDAFEGSDYERIEVSVRLADGSSRCAHAYRWRHRERLGDRDWDPQWFEREAITVFIDRHASGVRR